MMNALREGATRIINEEVSSLFPSYQTKPETLNLLLNTKM
jgi:hypothetical protein